MFKLFGHDLTPNPSQPVLTYPNTPVASHRPWVFESYRKKSKITKIEISQINDLSFKTERSEHQIIFDKVSNSRENGLLAN